MVKEEKQSMHWADQLADQIIARSEREGRAPNVKCQQTPSGGKHIGNLNDVLRAYFPVKAVEERGVKVDFVHTTDDRDPLKDIPAKISDLDGKWHESTPYLKLLNEYYGHPLCRTPDPFGCCKSYSAHFTQVWMDGIELLDVKPKLYSVNEMYEQGKYEECIQTVFAKREEAGKISSEFQATKSAQTIPFDAICPTCGVLGPVDEVDVKNRKVHMTCGGKAIKKKKAEGCGAENWVPWTEGKLQWRFEWPANWKIFNTTFEPFGKDHAEGSWKSGVAICKRIFEIEEPIPFVYEFFLVNGEKMSASKGNVYIVQDMLKVMPKDVFKFFYVKRPEKQRDLDLTKIPQMVDEFDEVERVTFGKSEARSENREENAKRMYDLSVSQIPKHAPVRIQFSLAAQLGQLFSADVCIEKLNELGHMQGATKQDILEAKERVELAVNWAKTYGDASVKVHVLSASEATEQKAKLSDKQKLALKEFADYFTKTNDSEQEQAAKIKATCEATGITPQEFFKAAYLVLIGKERGPKLTTLLNTFDKNQVIRAFN